MGYKVNAAPVRGVYKRYPNPPLETVAPEGRGDSPVILSLQNKVTEQQAQPRLAAPRNLSVQTDRRTDGWHRAYRPSPISISIFGGTSGVKPGARMLAVCAAFPCAAFPCAALVAPSFALDTRANAKQEGTP